LRLGVICGAVAGAFGCKTVPRDEFPDKYPLRAKYSPRWDTNETPLEEAGRVDRIGRNIRDGMVGVVNNWVQGGFTLMTISPTSGYIVQKGSIILGDVIGLLDDNEWTEHIFLGVISRQFLRFGTKAQEFTGTMGAIHDTTFDDPKHQTLDIVGPETFHVKVYGRPSALGAFGASAVADFVVRPAGNFLVVFGARDTAKKVDQAGLDLIQMGMDLPFL
jgi:hypothetical protein